MALITIGPRTQPDKIIKLGKNHEINLTTLMEFITAIAAVILEGFFISWVVNCVFRGVIPNFHFGWLNATALITLVAVLHGYTRGRMFVVQIERSTSQPDQQPASDNK